jgi:hypothetical protein
MVERGKAWKNVLIASGIALASLLPLKTNFSSKPPLEDRKPPVVQVNQLRAEEEKQDTVYLPQAVIDSAFGWKYGKVVDLNAYILNELGDGLGYPKLIKLSDRWAIATDADMIVVTELDGSSPIGKEKFGVTLSWEGKAMEEFRKKLKSKEMRFILYTDKDGHNCLVVKSSAEDMAICYAGVPRFGVIMAREGLTIGDIGFLPVDFDDGTKGLMVMAQIKGDGIVGIDIVREPKPYYSVEYRVEVASR